MPPQPRVFFDFTVAEEPLGRAVFELFSDVVPKTAENFRALCTGALGISPLSHLPLHYRSSIVHRIIEGFMIQGGDFTKRTGAGGESIYGGIFEDERLEGEGSEVDKPGLLVMANRGPGTNGSQWFVTLAPASHLTGKHVYALPLFPLLRDADPGRMLRVFGRVVSGFEHIQTIGRLPVDEKDRPISPVVISHCGELELRKPVKKPSPISEGSASPPRRKSRVRDGSEEKRPKKENEKRKRDKKVREETEEELDARLEREEKERLDAARLAKLAEMKRQLEDERDRLKNSGGVVYKGRGSMRYLDPESSSVRKVPHFEPRAPDVRPRRGPINVAAAATGERWQRGPDVNRPSFDRSALDRDLDRYGTKRQKEVEGKGTGRDHDDWRAGWRRSRSKEREGRQNGGVKKRSISPARGQRRRSVSPMRRARSPEAEKQRERTPSMRPESPLRGDRSGGSGSDMMIEEDD